jgi:peptide/nickel transport system permease protein
MGRYVIRRILKMVLVLWLISVLVYVLFFITPNDPAALSLERGATPEALAQVRARLNLDKPVIVQYWYFLKGFAEWPPNLGYSFRNREPVLDTILTRVPVTAALASGAAMLWVLFGIPIGILAATKPRSLRDRASTLFALVFVSMPTFFLGLTLIYFFFYKLTVSWNVRFQSQPVFLLGYDRLVGEGHVGPMTWVRHMILPWLTLGMVNVAVYSRMTRGSLLEVLGEDYIRTARAKGLSERRVTYRHGLRSALTPIVTLFGIDFGVLLGGAIITERIFNLPGLGQLALNAVTTTDLPVIVGTVLFASFFVVLANLIVDVVYAALDPRVRFS